MKKLSFCGLVVLITACYIVVFTPARYATQSGFLAGLFTGLSVYIVTAFITALYKEDK